MKKALTTIMVLACIGCDHRSAMPDPSKTGLDGAAVIERTFQAELPSGYSDPQTLTRTLMTKVIQGRFDISTRDFELFLLESKLLPDQLEDRNPLDGISDGIPWWNPSSLANTKGLSCQWEDGRDVASCNIAFGRLPDKKIETAFFMVVYEPKQSTGARPTVQADRTWKPESTKLQQAVPSDGRFNTTYVETKKLPPLAVIAKELEGRDEALKEDKRLVDKGLDAPRLEAMRRETLRQMYFPIRVEDRDTGNVYEVQTDRRTIVAKTKDGKILWEVNPYEDSKLKDLKGPLKVEFHKYPYICYFGAPFTRLRSEAKRYTLQVSFTSKEFGGLDIRNGKFTPWGSD